MASRRSARNHTKVDYKLLGTKGRAEIEDSLILATNEDSEDELCRSGDELDCNDEVSNSESDYEEGEISDSGDETETDLDQETQESVNTGDIEQLRRILKNKQAECNKLQTGKKNKRK